MRIIGFSALGHALMFAQLLLVLALRDSISAPVLITVLCVLALGKSIAYGALLRSFTLRLVGSATRFHSFLLVLTALMLVAIASYTADFAGVFLLDPTSITAMGKDDPLHVTLFNAWYFSVLNFSFFGVADIIPATIPTRFILALEAMASFLTLIFILSDFAALRDSIRQQTGKLYEHG